MYGSANGDDGSYHVNTKEDYIYGIGIPVVIVTGGLAIEFAPAIGTIYEDAQYTYSIINVSEATGIVIGIQGTGGVIDGAIRYKYDMSPDVPYIFPNSPVYQNGSNSMQWWLQYIND